jgi:hypothetical protein
MYTLQIIWAAGVFVIRVHERREGPVSI